MNIILRKFQKYIFLKTSGILSFPPSPALDIGCHSLESGKPIEVDYTLVKWHFAVLTDKVLRKILTPCIFFNLFHPAFFINSTEGHNVTPAAWLWRAKGEGGICERKDGWT